MEVFCEQCGEELNNEEVKKDVKICEECEETNYWLSDEG